MDLLKAEKLAIQLMEKNGLTKKGWQFKFCKAYKYFGICDYNTKSIRLSRKLTLLNRKSIINEVILHEIAHALVGPDKGHNTIWESKAIEIGHNLEVYYKNNVKIY